MVGDCFEQFDGCEEDSEGLLMNISEMGITRRRADGLGRKLTGIFEDLRDGLLSVLFVDGEGRV